MSWHMERRRRRKDSSYGEKIVEEASTFTEEEAVGSTVALQDVGKFTKKKLLRSLLL